MLSYGLILSFGLILATCGFCHGVGVKLEGANVCTRYEKHSQNMTVSDVNPRLSQATKWCMSKSENCSTYRIELIESSLTRIENKDQLVFECCTGYKKEKEGTKCIPHCSKDCIHGECTAPDFCECNEGYSRATCNLEREPDCQCQNNGTCVASTGLCTCLDGYAGRHCEVQCEAGRYGSNCKEQCRCKNGAQCEPTSGQCKCVTGYTGPLCEERCLGNCPPTPCPCQNGGTCTPDGHCVCNTVAGYGGPICATPCNEGTWGQNCSRRCECYNQAQCDVVTGECRCEPGFEGKDCMDPCVPGTWGKQCANQCTCPNPSMLCSPIDGSCSCAPGFKGYQCQERGCSEGLYGEKCDRPCACNVTHSKSCHPLTGQCECNPGWSGVTCAHQCPLLRWGEECARSCHCENGAGCNAQDGRCVCTPGYTGDRCQSKCSPGTFGLGCSQKCLCSPNGTVQCNPAVDQCTPTSEQCNPITDQCTPTREQCNPITGQCSCKPGWYGMLCDRQTKEGPNCDCDQGECNVVKGQCHCYPGFTGKSCSTPCPAGYYGVDCKQKCQCQNGAMCRSTDGECECSEGWMGTLCTRVCPPNKYGPHCMKECQCTEPNFACHPVDGCICEQGYIGKDCSVLKVPLQVPTSTSVTPLQPSSESKVTSWSIQDNGVIILILIMSTVGMIVFVVLYVNGKEFDHYTKPDEPRTKGSGKDFYYNQKEGGIRNRPGRSKDGIESNVYEDLKKVLKDRQGKLTPDDPEYFEIPLNTYEKIDQDRKQYNENDEPLYDEISKYSTHSKKEYDVLDHNRCTKEKDPHYKVVEGQKLHRRPSQDKLPTPESVPRTKFGH
uniref:Multiple epidermal growth factor-like domains protein 10 n=1 Tax=Cacopsylla melanoneura TaxID=428564 RepID=A0A8D8M538_9HEMI